MEFNGETKQEECRITLQPIEENAMKEIDKVLLEIENKLEIKILYACETGSRAVGVFVEESDYDIKGFYIAKEKEYLTVLRKIPPTYVKHHISLNIDGKEFDLDVEFRDLKYYFLDKIAKSAHRADFWFYSEIVYRNLIPNEVIDHLQNHLMYSTFLFSPNDKSGLATMKKNLKSGESLVNKKLLSLLISGIHFFHTILYESEKGKGNNSSVSDIDFCKFPFYNIFKEIEFLQSHAIMNKISNLLTSEEVELLLKNLKLVEGMYNRKRQGRWSTTKSIPENLEKFIEMVASKYEPEKKRKTLNDLEGSLPAKWAEQVFLNLLYKYK